jgi:hypothetical protein
VLIIFLFRSFYVIISAYGSLLVESKFFNPLLCDRTTILLRAGMTELVLPSFLMFDSLNFSVEARDDLARIRLSSGNRNAVGAALS